MKMKNGTKSQSFVNVYLFYPAEVSFSTRELHVGNIDNDIPDIYGYNKYFPYKWQTGVLKLWMINNNQNKRSLKFISL